MRGVRGPGELRRSRFTLSIFHGCGRLVETPCDAPGGTRSGKRHGQKGGIRELAAGVAVQAAAEEETQRECDGVIYLMLGAGLRSTTCRLFPQIQALGAVLFTRAGKSALVRSRKFFGPTGFSALAQPHLPIHLQIQHGEYYADLSLYCKSYVKIEVIEG